MMILADKIMEERKKNGWSQEELAEKLGVTRQSVSKWEGAQSVPDLNRILEMSRLFGVSTDYLLKDDMENYPAAVTEPLLEESPLRVINMEEARRFLERKRENAPRIAAGVFLCILGAAILVLTIGLSEFGVFPLGEEAAVGVGMVLLLLCVAAAATLFIRSGQRTREFDFLEQEPFETAYGVVGMVRETKREYSERFGSCYVIGTVLCILGVIPLFGAVVFTQDESVYVMMAALMLLLIGVGTSCFVLAGVNRGAVDMLLEEGDYIRRRKRWRKQAGGVISGGYWLFVTAVFLVWSFLTEGWERTWIVWPVAGVLFPLVITVAQAVSERRGARGN